jgi:peptidoglycan/LPS O-acetylase OafA/YrhL
VLHVSRYSAFTLRYHGTITLLLALLATICLAELSFRFLETAFLKSPGTLGTAPFRVRIRAPAAA